MTPRALGALFKRRGELDQDKIDRFAAMQSLLMNAHFKRNGGPWTPQDFGARRPSPEVQALLDEGKAIQAEIDRRVKERAIPDWAVVTRGGKRG